MPAVAAALARVHDGITAARIAGSTRHCEASGVGFGIRTARCDARWLRRDGNPGGCELLASAARRTRSDHHLTECARDVRFDGLGAEGVRLHAEGLRNRD